MSPTCGCPWSLEEGTGSLGFGELLVVVSHWISVLGAKLQSSIKATSSLNQLQTISSVQGIQHPLLATMGTVLKLNLKRSCVSCSGTHNKKAASIRESMPEATVSYLQCILPLLQAGRFFVGSIIWSRPRQRLFIYLLFLVLGLRILFADSETGSQ